VLRSISGSFRQRGIRKARQACKKSFDNKKGRRSRLSIKPVMSGICRIDRDDAATTLLQAAGDWPLAHSGQRDMPAAAMVHVTDSRCGIDLNTLGWKKVDLPMALQLA